jgi:uncharacterized protein (TIGR02301 family)
MGKLLLTLIILLSAAPAAMAQDRSPAQRQTLVDLAFVLGESHALRQACLGAGDQFWRTRMLDLQAAEQPDDGLGRRLREAFNTGFSSGRMAHPDCSGESRAAEAAAAARGRALAESLAAPS